MEVATPQAEINQRLEQLGWEVSGIAYKGGEYIAKGKNSQSGQSFEAGADSPEMALVAVYQYALRATEVRQRASAWQNHWYSQLHEIAKAYADLPPYESKAAEAWQALAAESEAQAILIQQQVRVEFIPHPQPYESPKAMSDDVHKKGHLFVSTTELNHPLWVKEQLLAFRIAHDVLGVCQSGGGWSWPGANKAVANHMPLLSPLAQEALFVEVIGRTAYETVFRGIGGERVALMTEFLQPVQLQEGNHIII